MCLTSPGCSRHRGAPLPAWLIPQQAEGREEGGVSRGPHVGAEAARLLQGIFLQQARKGPTFLARVLRRPGNVALMEGQEGTEVGPLKLLDDPRFHGTEGGVPRPWGWRSGRGQLDILWRHDRRGGQEYGPLDDGLQFADVPWPGMPH